MSDIYIAKYHNGYHGNKEVIITYVGEDLEAAKDSVKYANVAELLRDQGDRTDEITLLSVDIYRDGKFLTRTEEKTIENISRRVFITTSIINGVRVNDILEEIK